MDDHQTDNVVDLVEAGGAISFQQPAFTPAEVAKHIQRMALEPGALEEAAERAASCGLPNATRDLADLVESLARSEEHTSELQSLMSISYAVFCLKQKSVRIN